MQMGPKWGIQENNTPSCQCMFLKTFIAAYSYFYPGGWLQPSDRYEWVFIFVRKGPIKNKDM